MKNLFQYATKELTQDAFLRWLIENYDCEDKEVSSFALDLLSAFINKPINNKNQITNLKTLAQWKKIDILIKFSLNNTKHLIAIEDKTFSTEHNQLLTYNDSLNNEKSDYEIHKIFFKTSILNTEEELAVNNAGWTIYDIKKIYEDFLQSNKYSSTKSQILSDYINHIKRLYQEYFNYKSIPINEWPGRNAIFYSYMKNLNFNAVVWQGRYVYAYKKYDVDNLNFELYFEFRPEEFVARINYRAQDGQNETYFSALKELIANNNIVDSEFYNARRNQNFYNIARTTTKPNTFNTFNDFDFWIKSKIQQIETLVNLIRNKKLKF